jgi:hypothetical protein
VTGLGHEVIAREIYVKEVGAVAVRERPDVALVGLGLHLPPLAEPPVPTRQAGFAATSD